MTEDRKHHRVVGQLYSNTILPADMPAPDRRVLYDGPWFGPVMFHYLAEGCDARAVAAEHGLDLLYVMLEDDDGPEIEHLAQRYADGDDAEAIAALWLPKPREGWTLAGMADSDDGIFAMFLRPIPTLTQEG